MEENRETVKEIQVIEQKIARLIDVLAESEGTTIVHGNRKVLQLNKEQEIILARASQQPKRHVHPSEFDFASMTFEEKKLVAGHIY